MREKKKKKRYQRPGIVKIKVDFKDLVRTYCPVLYSWNGSSWIEENNLLYQSEDLGRKVKFVVDRYILKYRPYFEEGRRVKFKIREIENDISYFRYFKFYFVRHPEEYRVVFDEEGELIGIKKDKFILPSASYDDEGREISNLVSELNWETPTNYFEAFPGSSLRVRFKKIKFQEPLLVINDPYLRYAVKEVKNEIPTCVHIWMLEPYRRFIKTLYPAMHFTVEAIALRKYFDKLPEDLMLGFEFTALHKISFIGIAKREEIKLDFYEFPLRKISHSKKGKLTFWNYSHLFQLEPGEELLLEFEVPPSLESEINGSFVFQTEGYYHPALKFSQLALKKEVQKMV